MKMPLTSYFITSFLSDFAFSPLCPDSSNAEIHLKPQRKSSQKRKFLSLGNTQNQKLHFSKILKGVIVWLIKYTLIHKLVFIWIWCIKDYAKPTTCIQVSRAWRDISLKLWHKFVNFGTNEQTEHCYQSYFFLWKVCERAKSRFLNC